MTQDHDSIVELGADEISKLIHTREISCREVAQAFVSRIHSVNPRFNAIVSMIPDDEILQEADQRDAELARGSSRGWLHGIPQAIKDTGDAAGFPTTFGSRTLKDNVAAADGVMVSRMRACGCIVVGKTNMPEFGLGSHTINELFGPTGNAWDPDVSAGGSSGGAAVALAQRMLPVADGSDFMGSLRNPAAWNNIFGMRPSQGRIPFFPQPDVWLSQMATEGPMARSVVDLARLLEIQSGFDERSPLSLSEPMPTVGLRPDRNRLKDLRVGWLGNMSGYLPIEEGLLECCSDALRRLEGEGSVVEEIELGFSPSEVWDAWLVWRQALVGPRVGKVLRSPGARDMLSPEALWEHDESCRLSMVQFSDASETRTRFYLHMLSLFERFDVIALPMTQVWPFPIGERWPKVVASRPMDTYHRWMEVAIYATFGGLPAISLPAGFDTEGRWPAGLQLIGPPRGDMKLLQIAQCYEDLIPDILARRPW